MRIRLGLLIGGLNNSTSKHRGLGKIKYSFEFLNIQKKRTTFVTELQQNCNAFATIELSQPSHPVDTSLEGTRLTAPLEPAWVLLTDLKYNRYHYSD